MHQKFSSIDLLNRSNSALLSSYLFRKMLKKWLFNLPNDQDSWGVFWIAVSSTSREEAILLFGDPNSVLPLFTVFTFYLLFRVTCVITYFLELCLMDLK